MRRILPGIAVLALLLGVGGPDRVQILDPVRARSVDFSATAVMSKGMHLSNRLRFVGGWRLRSNDGEFGGLSALVVGPDGLVALSDRGVLFLFQRTSPPRSVAIRSLPAGCAGELKAERDTESITRDPVGGDYWIGFEWRNAICRANGDLSQARALARPAKMRDWWRTGGPEALTRLSDGRFVAIAERGRGGGRDSALLVFGGDPAAADTDAVERRYLSPEGYKPVDVAELPDGSLLVLHRRFRLPLDFASIVSLVPRMALDKEQPIRGRPLAVLNGPGVTDNYEGLAVERRNGRNYVWLVSDDNFVPTQETYLLKFELSGSSGVR